MSLVQISRLAVEASRALVRGEPYEATVIDGVVGLLRSDAGAGITFCHLDDVMSRSRHAGNPRLTATQQRDALSVLSVHPAVRAMLNQRTLTPVRVSDLIGLREFWTTPTYRKMHGWCDGRFPVGVLLERSAGSLVFLGVHRQVSDFHDGDMQRLAVLQDLLVKAIAFRRELDIANARIRDGAAETPECPAEAAAALCRDYRPTPRQADVLSLAAEGWTNGQIGRRLSITERTVRKHLSDVYERAGLTGRVAATQWWARRIRQL